MLECMEKVIVLNAAPHLDIKLEFCLLYAAPAVKQTAKQVTTIVLWLHLFHLPLIAHIFRDMIYD